MRKMSQRDFVLIFKFSSSAYDLGIQMKIVDLVDDAAGEEGGRFLAVCMEVERHQGIRPHGEVVVHGQNLRSTCSVCFNVYC